MVFISVAVEAQYFSTRNDLENNHQPETGFDVARGDTGYVVIEAAYGANSFLRVGEVFLNTQGVVTSSRSFGGDSLSFYPGRANCSDKTSDGGWVTFGSYSDIGGDSVQGVFWRFNSNGDSLWTLSMFPGSTVKYVGAMAKALSDGRIMGCGAEYSGAGETGQFFLMQLDGNGDTLWTRSYGGPTRDECFSMDLCADGGFILGGWTETNGGFNYDMRVMKTDSLGHLQWQRVLGGPYIDTWANVVATSNGDFLVAGDLGVSQVNISAIEKLYAARLDTDGSVIWERTYGSGSTQNQLNSVKECSNGAFIAAGDYSNDVKGVLLKIAANGDSLWMRTYQHPPLVGQFTTHLLQDVVPEPDGGFSACGMLNDGQQDLWVIRVDSFGCLVPGCQMYDHIAEQGVELHVGLYPNPAHDRVYISFRSARDPSGEFVMYNSSGEAVRRFKSGGASEEIDLDISSQPVGLYLLRYEDKQGTRWESKFVKE